MKQLLTTIAAVVLVGCGESQPPEPPTAETPDTSILDAAFKDIEAVKQHLAAGADVNVKDESGRTALLQAALFGRKEITELLIAAGADVNAKDDWGMTPLHEATREGHKEITDLLLTNGADVNAKDGSGRTPLDWAIPYNHKETVDLLRKHGGKTGEELKAESK